MDRRQFIKSAAMLTAALASPRLAIADGAFNPSPENGWRVFEATVRVDLPPTESITRVWLPLPSLDDTDWFKGMGNVWQGNAESVTLLRDEVQGVSMLAASWEAGEDTPVIEAASRFATRDRSVDFGIPGKATPLDKAQVKFYTRPTRLLPIDGIVKKTARDITFGAKTDLDKARAIYQWVVENTSRNPKTPGCGIGDIRGMLSSGDLSGKCADINALFVGLARSSGLPARDVYGIRVADSRFGYKSLGKSGDITKAQHCRAEVWLDGFGWVPVDPADVRKVMLEEKPGLFLVDEMVAAAREKLFGSWEMNWLAYNFAHDLKLPGSSGSGIPFFMYPQGENAKGYFDSLAPESFRYKITSREIKPEEWLRPAA